ncbi:MAG: phosphatase PAP2 family protein [Bacteroidota bacterium]
MPGALIFGLMTQTFNFHFAQNLKKLRPFLGSWILYVIALAVLLFSMGYYDSFLFLNAFRNSFLDTFMPHFTHVGEGVTVAMVFAFLIFNKDRALVNTLIVALVILGILLWTLKQFVFVGWNRPPKIFENLTDIYYISLGGEKYKSFPSGHSSAVWMMMSFIAFYLRDRKIAWQILAALVAITVAYSRVYIGVHFPADILAGSFIGVGLAFLSFSFHYPRMQKREREGKLNLGYRRYILQGFMVFLLVGSLIRMYQDYYL